MQLFGLRRVDGILFTLATKVKCSHWSSGKHIVTEDGTCKCGKRFFVDEVID